MISLISKCLIVMLITGQKMLAIMCNIFELMRMDLEIMCSDLTDYVRSCAVLLIDRLYMLDSLSAVIIRILCSTKQFFSLGTLRAS